MRSELCGCAVMLWPLVTKSTDKNSFSMRTHAVKLCCAVQDGGLRHTVYYPTPAALETRIKLASELGVGLSIWELGQGMDSFLDLL